jgi:hypothetical protein
LLLAVVVVGVWLGILVDPLIGPLALGLLTGLGLTLGVMLAALCVSWLGLGIFAIVDRLAGWGRRTSTWPK